MQDGGGVAAGGVCGGGVGVDGSGVGVDGGAVGVTVDVGTGVGGAVGVGPGGVGRVVGVGPGEKVGTGVGGAVGVATGGVAGGTVDSGTCGLPGEGAGEPGPPAVPGCLYL